MPVLEPEILHPKTRKRGPKPLGVRAGFAATAWLEGELLWRDGRVVWRFDGRILEVGPRELDAVCRALSSLRRHEKAARRSCADFDSWHARRLHQWTQACHLAAIRAPDLEALASPSRRRNPAALDRLAQLLAVEAGVAQPLPVSAARALFEAYPLSQRALQTVMRDEKQPLRARALAALALGAARPLDALPGQPFLRRAARYGARFGFPPAPELCVALLENSFNAENGVRRVQNSLGIRSPLGFDATQLSILQRAGRDAQSLADWAQAVSQLPDPFPSISFAPVAMKRFDLAEQRAISRQYQELRFTSHHWLRDVLTQIARRADVGDLAAISSLLNHLISAPVHALGALKVQRNRLPRKELDAPPFENSIGEAVAVALQILQAVAQSHEPGALLQLLQEVVKNSGICAPDEDLSPAIWAARWHIYARNQHNNRFSRLLQVAQQFGVASAREALRLNCWRELSRQRQLPCELVGFALEIAAFAPASASDIVSRFEEWGHFWNGEAGARAAWMPLINALAPLPPDQRAAWLSEVCAYSESSRRAARVELPALTELIPAMLRARKQSAALESQRVAKATSANATSANANAAVSDAVAAGAILTGDDNLPLWTLVETAFALQRAAPHHDAASALKRFDWLAGEMARLWSASESKPGWGNVGELVAWLSQLAGESDAKFRAFMASGWRYAGWDNDFEWPDMKSGAKLARQFPPLEATLTDNFARCPARCFALLEKLGPLQRFDSIRVPLETWRHRSGATLGDEWETLDLDAHLASLAARFASAQAELGESPDPSSAMQKIALWPQKMKAEIAALRARGDLSPNLAKRVENLISRLENAEELRASMRAEISESLQNATFEAELRAAERCVEGCYRAHLEILGAPKDLVLDADWLNAALFSTDLESSRKWLREIVRARPENANPENADSENADWRLEIAGNARWLKEASERGLNRENWLAASPRIFEIGSSRFELRLENGPLQILQMGNYFGTCLSRGGCNAHSSVANAVELNKRVVFARDAKNRVVGRQLLALSKEEKLLGFRVYLSAKEEHAAPLRAAFGVYARDFAARCGIERGDEGEIERLFVADWWDDGAINWCDLEPAPREKKKEQRS